eukprot:gene19660-39091_t
MQDQDAKPLLVLMHGNRKVSTKNLARQVGLKSVEPCTPEVANRHSGYLVGGTSPFGANGFNPQGIRIGQEKGRNRSAVKVWDQRAYKDYDDSQELGTRNIKIAMRRLRRFARDGAAEELDIDGTINGTARKGWLDIQMRPERRNAIKLLLLLDVGGSMDPFIKLCEELFSAATS